jgi:hypothetical protein
MYYLGKDSISNKFTTLKSITFDPEMEDSYLGLTHFVTINGVKFPKSITLNPSIIKIGRPKMREILYHELYHVLYPNYEHCHEKCNEIMSSCDAKRITNTGLEWVELVKNMFLRIEHKPKNH